MTPPSLSPLPWSTPPPNHQRCCGSSAASKAPSRFNKYDNNNLTSRIYYKEVNNTVARDKVSRYLCFLGNKKLIWRNDATTCTTTTAATTNTIATSADAYSTNFTTSTTTLKKKKKKIPSKIKKNQTKLPI